MQGWEIRCLTATAGMASDPVRGGPVCHRAHTEEPRVPVCILALSEGIYGALAQLERPKSYSSLRWGEAGCRASSSAATGR